MEKHLATLPTTNRRVEIAFFGGSFTGLPLDIQKQYLEAAQHWIKQGQIDGIRLSTRPDYINKEIIDLLLEHGVSCVELGAQSLDDTVLQLSGRGHTALQVEQASQMILQAGIELGLQMMTGLPGDTLEKTMATARGIVRLGATNTRIYPAVVIKDTPLEKLFLEGSYKPLELNEAIKRCAMLLDLFESENIKVLRMGLHPSHDLLEEGQMVAGPWHPAMKELALTSLWENVLRDLTIDPYFSKLCVTVATNQLNVATGYKAQNKKMLERYYRKVIFKTDDKLSGRKYYAGPC